jgi:outer membrane receptor for ferrienterochelin and colicins
LLKLLDGRTKFRISVGKGFKSPTIRQLYYDAPFKHKNYYIQSNPDLEPEHGVGYSLGIEHLFSERCTFNICFFRNEIKDMVTRYDTGQTYQGLPLMTYKNIAKATTEGIEFEFRWELMQGLKNYLSYTLLKTRDEETGRQLTYRPKRTFGWRLMYENKPWEFKACFGLRYVGPMFKDTANTRQTNGYFVAEAKLVKQINRYLSLSFEIDNIFDTDYGDPSVDTEGRTFMVKLGLSF